MCLIHRVELRPTGINLEPIASGTGGIGGRMITSDVRFFVTHSAKCALRTLFDIMYASPFASGGSLNPRSFCFSLKFASMQR